MSDEDNVEIFEGLLERMAERYELLDRGLDEAQRGLTYGDYALVITPSEFNTMFVVGRILEVEEIEMISTINALVREGIYEKSGAGTQPAATEEAEQARYDQGFRYGLWHFEDNPVGQTAYVHLTRLYPITREEYESAKAYGFRAGTIGPHDWFVEVRRAVISAIEELETSPRRARCLRCHSHDTALRTYYRGKLDSHAAMHGEVVRMGTPINDEVDEVTRRCMVCLECGYESPDLSKESGWTFEDVSQPGLTVLETVWDYGSDLPRPDWD